MGLGIDNRITLVSQSGADQGVNLRMDRASAAFGARQGRDGELGDSGARH